MTNLTSPATTFSLPPGNEATGPPEARGLARDGVRLLVARPGSMVHARFRDLGDHLDPGDLVVVNTSATLPAAIDATWRGRDIVVHFSTRLDDTTWVVELRHPDGHGPVLDAQPGDPIELAGDGGARLETPMGQVHDTDSVRLWRTRLYLPASVERHLGIHGRPITYGYLDHPWPLETYQTVFARVDDPSGASAEMPSAARPFTPGLVTDLVSRGVGMAHIVLHAGVSSLERHEPPQPEHYIVPPMTAEMVSLARRRESRVIAVGTTVTRALETVSQPDGTVRAGRGWTGLVLGPDRPGRVVDGLVTGWHPPDASHLPLLEAVVGPELVAAAYREALQSGYLWHEFGDSCLFLR